MTQEFRVEGIVLKAFPFKENDRILTLFTAQGLLKLFVKGRRKPNLTLNALTTPLTCGEYIYVKGRGDLDRFRDGTVVAQHLDLRESLERLKVAHRMADALFQTQWPGKNGERLYALFRTFLLRLSEMEKPSTLLATFYLKLLAHEGGFQSESRCSVCQKEEQPIFRQGGERFCRDHAPLSALSFEPEEEKIVQYLSQLRSLKGIAELCLPEEVEGKVEALFHETVRS